MIQERILELTEYGLVTGLVEPEDRRFTIKDVYKRQDVRGSRTG